MTTPCAGQWELFDSTAPRDHHEAKALCATCPAFAACLDALAAARAQACVPADIYGPAGTWAGQLVGPPQRISAARIKAEDEMFSDAELRAFHTDYAAGLRDTRTVVGERVYNRRRKRQQHARKRAA